MVNLSHNIWNVSDTANDNWPTIEGSRLEKLTLRNVHLRGIAEDPKDFLPRTIKNGRIVRNGNLLYIVFGGIYLVLPITSQKPQITLPRDDAMNFSMPLGARILEVETMIEDVEAVTIREMNLRYSRFFPKSAFSRSIDKTGYKIDAPDEIRIL